MAYQIISVIIAAVLQNSGTIVFLGVKPNLVLSAVIPLIFFTNNFWRYFFIVFLPSVLLTSIPLWDLPIIIFAVFSAIAYFAKDFLPWQSSFNNIILIIIGTVVINIAQFFPLEILYNVLISTGFYLAYAKNKL